jgi:hypothetical protein
VTREDLPEGIATVSAVDQNYTSTTSIEISVSIEYNTGSRKEKWRAPPGRSSRPALERYTTVTL